jgi:hypothetical protein
MPESTLSRGQGLRIWLLLAGLPGIPRNQVDFEFSWHHREALIQGHWRQMVPSVYRDPATYRVGSCQKWDSPTPSPAGERAPPFRSRGRGTLAGERGWESPNSDIHTVVLYVLCASFYLMVNSFSLMNRLTSRGSSTRLTAHAWEDKLFCKHPLCFKFNFSTFIEQILSFWQIFLCKIIRIFRLFISFLWLLLTWQPI